MTGFVLFSYILACFGISEAIVYFNGPFGIIERLREVISPEGKTGIMKEVCQTLTEMTSCMLCFPTNLGFLMSIVSMLMGTYFTPFTIIFSSAIGNITLPVFLGCCVPCIVLDGFFTGGCVYIIHNIIDAFSGINEEFEEEGDEIDSRRLRLDD